MWLQRAHGDTCGRICFYGLWANLIFIFYCVWRGLIRAGVGGSVFDFEVTGKSRIIERKTFLMCSYV